MPVNTVSSLHSSTVIGVCVELKIVKMENKKQRAPNFTKQQRAYLVDKIHQKKDTIEGSCKSAKAVNSRKQEWIAITDDFNKTFPSACRTKAQLEIFWKSRKIAAKKSATDQRKSTKKTGGGPPEKAMDNESAMVLDAIGEDADPLTNSFDDDAEMATSEESDAETDDAASSKNTPSTSGTEKWRGTKRRMSTPTKLPSSNEGKKLSWRYQCNVTK